MDFYSTNSNGCRANAKNAVLQGLASDGGLYMPAEIPSLSKHFLDNLENLSFQEIAFEIAKSFFSSDINDTDLRGIIESALTFPAPVVNIHDNINTLELFHGPTLAFKDFGARFMARTMSHFLNENEKQHLTILVATSGDTGSAVAQGFLDCPNIDVIILYPAGKVSKIQEMQLTTIGHNITALEVNGTFDDCQRLVKTAFADKNLTEKFLLGSANSINIARLIPQIFYYFEAYKQLKNKKLATFFAVPSGNFGNLTACLMAKIMGLPIEKIIAATNINDVVPQYLESGVFSPHPSYQTIANAMDVGNPSNFARLQDICKKDLNTMRNYLWGLKVTDDEALQAIKEVKEKYNYTLDPHGAMGYVALSSYLKQVSIPSQGIFLETAHPAKFGDVVTKVLTENPAIPERLATCLNGKKETIKISTAYIDLKEYLLTTIN